jgi:prolyl-tRNA editing enzyme YbaK/EbsC (Cys-tRNA(Pro) deacylase)
MPASLTPNDLQNYIDQRGIDAELIHLEMPTPTVESAAEAVRVDSDQIVKSLLFLIQQNGGDDRAVLVIASGIGKIDRRILGKHFGVNRRKTIFADAKTVLDLTGYPVGAVPPLGHRQPLEVLVNPDVLKHTVVFGGGGSDHALLKLHPKDILKYNQAVVISLQRVAEE